MDKLYIIVDGEPVKLSRIPPGISTWFDVERVVESGGTRQTKGVEVLMSGWKRIVILSKSP